VRQLRSQYRLRDVQFKWDGLSKQVLALREQVHAAMEHAAHPRYSVLQMQTTRSMLAAPLVSRTFPPFPLTHLNPMIDSACRGSIEGNPVCADSSWSLWKGFQGNGFCCQVGLNGVYNSGNTVAGTCVSGAPPAGYTTAAIVSFSVTRQ
jgi:hypothetical protein